jgi:hypothetical protein
VNGVLRPRRSSRREKRASYWLLIVLASTLASVCGGDPASPNTKPTVSISSPTAGPAGVSSEPIRMEGSASDAEDGDLDEAIVWWSDVDGRLGAGASLSTALSEGSHVVEARVTEAGGAAATATVRLDVETLPDLTGVWEGALTADSVTYFSLTDDGSGAVTGTVTRYVWAGVGTNLVRFGGTGVYVYPGLDLDLPLQCAFCPATRARWTGTVSGDTLRGTWSWEDEGEQEELVLVRVTP